MAREPVVKIQGNQLVKVLTVSYGIVNRSDADGRPTKNHRPIGVTISRIVDGATDVTAWAERTAREARKDGTVEFFHPSGKTMKTLEWEGGYVEDYSISYDQAGDHAVEEFTIIAERMTLEGSTVDYKWDTHN